MFHSPRRVWLLKCNCFRLYCSRLGVITSPRDNAPCQRSNRSPRNWQCQAMPRSLVGLVFPWASAPRKRPSATTFLSYYWKKSHIAACPPSFASAPFRQAHFAGRVRRHGIRFPFSNHLARQRRPQDRPDSTDLGMGDPGHARDGRLGFSLLSLSMIRQFLGCQRK